MKTVIVTGAGGNLGQAVVKKFIAEGCRVIGTVTKKGTDSNTDPRYEVHAVNLTDDKETQQFVEKIISKYSVIDVAVLTVGGFAAGNIANTSATDLLQQFQLNFETAFNAARPIFLKMLEQKKGNIFLIGAKPGLSNIFSKGMVAYGLSKSLLFRLAELMNEEATGTDVVTAVVVPGTIDTPQNRQEMPGADADRWIKPETIANAIYNYSTADAGMPGETVLKLYTN